MKRALFLVMLVSLSLASNFGQSIIEIEREWTISGGSGEMEFEGALAVNSSSQKVLHIETEPVMDVTVSDEGDIRVSYTGPLDGNRVLRARAVAEIEYNPKITRDSGFDRKPVNFTDYTEPNEEITALAEQLAVNDSILMTMLNLVNWTHKNIGYDISYFENPQTAREVFSSRKGVCVEYSHIIISLAGSLGIRTRYVSGYVYSGEWQPHSWVEFYLPDYGWVAADPTFAQIGSLDNTHFSLAHGDCQESVFDIVSSRDSVELSVSEKLSVESDTQRKGAFMLDFAFDENSLGLDLLIKNQDETYSYGTYEFVAPRGYGGITMEPVLLLPLGELEKRYLFNYNFMEGYRYTIPVSASVNDDNSSYIIEIARQRPMPSSDGEACLPSFVLPVVLLLLLKTS